MYGGYSKYDGLKSTIDLSEYGADYRFMDLSGGSSTLTGINFKNYDANKYSYSESTSMPFIFLGDNKIQNYQSSLVNCTFENITLNKKQPLVRMAFMDDYIGGEPMMSGGVIDGCTFIGNKASQLIAIAGSPSDNEHMDDGPVFYGFNASNNKFINNSGYAEFDSLAQSLGFAFKIWSEAVNVTLHNNTFINNTNAVHGAAYCIIGTNVTITDNYIEANQAVYGAGIESHVGNITIINSTFVNNVASGNHSQYSYRDGSGAAIALLGCNNYIYNCTFINNTAHGHAGAIDIVGGMHNVTKDDWSVVFEYVTANNTVIENSRFYHNIAYDYAGGVHVNGTNTRIENSTFEDNNASFAGGARLIGENTTINKSNFTSNHAIQGGGCYIEGENALISNSIFTDNNATHGVPIVRPNATMISSGGALHIVGSLTNVLNNTFIKNHAVGDSTGAKVEGLGGAIVWLGSDGVVDGCDFKNNTATSLGGAVYLDASNKDSSKNTTFSNSQFENNHADVNGGAIDWHEGAEEGTIDACSFENNSAAENGGAVFWNGHEGKIIDSNFTKNTADKGGAVYWLGLIGSVDNSRFIANNATNGGAIYLQNCKHGDDLNLNITSSYFDNNIALEDGGAINWYSGKDINIKESEFMNNTANRGGAAFIYDDTDAQVLTSEFRYNRAVQGGAIYLAGRNNKISNSLFEYNNATYDLGTVTADSAYKTKGGAIYIDGEGNVIENSKFYNNTANATNKTSRIVQNTPGLLGAYLETTGVDDDGLGGAIYVGANNNKINSNEFDYNVARNGSAIYNNASGTYLSNGLLVKNQAWSYVLEVNGTPEKSFYGSKVSINVYDYVAGDNILNGIYNAKGVTDVTFNNVGYIIDNDESKVRRTQASDINPVLGAKEGVLYQDSLERYQVIIVKVVNDETGETVAEKSILTDLCGNHTFDLLGLPAGNYTINAYHPEDRNYKYIGTVNKFEIIPLVILNITKTVDNDDYGVGDMVTFKINVTNEGPSNATNVKVVDALPAGLDLVSGDLNTVIPFLASGNSTIITVVARTTAEGTYVNKVNVTCDENSTVKSANATVHVYVTDLKINKTVDRAEVLKNETVNFTIIIKNHGKAVATNVNITDVLDDAFEFVDAS